MGYELKGNTKLSMVANELKLDWAGVDITIKSVSSFVGASVGDLTFSRGVFNASNQVACITTVNPDEKDAKIGGYILSSNPRLDFIRALNFLSESIGFATWDKPAQVHPTAVIGQNVVIEAGCVIEANAIIEHNVVLHAGTRIGNNSRIRSCSSIGGDGFGYERLEDGTPLHFPHLGGVFIGNNVEIGACTTVARGTLSDTVIEDNVKIDNLVHVAHNCLIQRGAFIIACAELSGGVVVGRNAWVAPNSCTHQKVNIGDGSIVGLGAVVTKDVPPNSVYAGNPAKKIRELK